MPIHGIERVNCSSTPSRWMWDSWSSFNCAWSHGDSSLKGKLNNCRTLCTIAKTHVEFLSISLKFFNVSLFVYSLFYESSAYHQEMQLKFWMAKVMKWQSGKNAILLIPGHITITTWPSSLLSRVRKGISIYSGISQLDWPDRHRPEGELFEGERRISNSFNNFKWFQ